MSAPVELTTESVVVAVAEQVSSELAGETVILSLRDSTYYGLNEVGTRVWELVQTPMRVGAIRDLLLEEYEVEPAQCEADLLALLQELADRDLVTVRRSASTESGTE